LETEEQWFDFSAGARDFLSSKAPNPALDPPNLPFSGYQPPFDRVWSGSGLKLIIHLHLMPKPRLHGAILTLHHEP